MERKFYIFSSRGASLPRRVFVSAILLLIAGALLLRSTGYGNDAAGWTGARPSLTVETPSGSSLEDTEFVMEQVERAILEEPAAVRVSPRWVSSRECVPSAAAYRGRLRDITTISWTPRTERNETIWQLQDRLRSRLEKIPNIRISW
jgi:HAE1 family hydrophobic/amphiphilic exporter-1